MKSLLSAALSVAIATGAFAVTHGAWTAVPNDKGTVHVSMSRGAWQNMGVTFSPAELGLDPAAMRATTSTPVTMSLQRDAGTLVLEGTFKDGYGAGQFTFTPNGGYIDALRSAAVEFEVGEGKTEEEQLLMAAVIDLSPAYVRSMRQLFPAATYHDVKRARAVGVTTEAIADLRGAGLRVDDLHEVVRLCAVGVTAEYVRSLRGAGVDVRDAHDATRLRAVDVTPQFVAELAAAGYKNLSTRDLVRLAATGVNAEFARKMSKYAKPEKP